MTPFEWTILSCTVIAASLASYKCWDTWGKLLPRIALPLVLIVYAVNHWCIPTPLIESIRPALANICLMSSLRPSQTSDMKAIPEELHSGMNNVEPLHRKFEWFCLERIPGH